MLWLNHVRGENDSRAYYIEITILIRTVLWTWKGTAKMEWRIAHQLNTDIFRLIAFIITLVESTQIDQT
jgi:hypothetical protein